MNSLRDWASQTPTEYVLRSLATPSTLDDFVLAVWKSRLQLHIQHILASVENEKPETLTRMADRIHEIRSDTGLIAATSTDRITAVPNPLALDVGPGNSFADTIKEFSDQIKQIKAQMNAFSIENRRRSRSRDTPRPNGLCFYHAKYRERAPNCRSPCTWKSGNAICRP